MSGKFDSRFLEELKSKNNIAEVIASYVPLDRKGGQYWACCPFHHEKTASFAVREDEGFFHCFGCGVSGDVVKFVQEIESTDFMGAIRILAKRAKMEVPENDFDGEHAAELKKKRDTYAKIMLDSARFYLSNLYSGQAEAHQQYIANRKLSPTTVKKFGLGASLDFYSLPDYLAGKGYMRQDLIDCGVLAESQKSNRLIDAQGGRLIFPIINAFDEVIAFGGRILEKKDFAKYKNTKETLLFNKSKTLYNINLLKKLKREQPVNEVIVVEGYMDTISLYQAGFKNVVASMGTSLTRDQAKLLKRYTSNAYISYDGDFAGQKADLRGLEILKDEAIKVRVVPLPEGLDPDDVAKQGADAYQKCLDNAMPLIDYKIHSAERKYDLTRSEDKRDFCAEALAVVAEAESETETEDLLKKLREKTGISYQSLDRDLQNIKRSGKKTEPETSTVQTVISAPELRETGLDKLKKAARYILAAKLFHAPYTENFDIKSVEFDDETHILVAKYIADCEERGEKTSVNELFEVLEDNSPEFNGILDLYMDEKLMDKTGEKFFSDSVKTLGKEKLESRIKELVERLSSEKDVEKRKEIATELDRTTKLLKANGK